MSREDLVREGSFSSPLEIACINKKVKFAQKNLTDAIGSFRRTIGIVYFKFPKHYFDPSQVRGLEFQKRRLECHTPLNWGKYEIRCDGNGRDFASYIHNRETRETILKAYYGVFGDDFHASVLEVLKARKNFALSLGFKSWSEMQSVMNGFRGGELSGYNFAEYLYAEGAGRIRKLVTQLKRNYPGGDEQYMLTQHRLESVPKNETTVAMTRRESIFSHEKILPKIFSIISDLFSVSFEPVESSLFLDGWHPTVKIYRVLDSQSSERLGYVYLDLFRRGSGGGMPPHCSVLMPENHIRVYMGFHPPYRSDVTLKKERNFTFDEISALMHELGHCMHLLLRPNRSPISQLPLDMRETVSILTEMYCETDEFIDTLTGGKLDENGKKAIRRNEFFHVDIIRNVAVSEYLHSSKFDPHNASVADLKRVSREVYGKFSPLPVPEYVNPLGGELSNYLIDGESRVGYLLSYVRAASILNCVKMGNTSGKYVFEQIRKEFIERSFDPIVSDLVESRIRQSDALVHPLPPILKNAPGESAGLFGSCTVAPLWEYSNIPKVK